MPTRADVRAELMRRVLTEQVVDALAVIPPQAASAEALVSADVDAAQRAVAAVQRSAEGALGALRRLLTVLPEAVASPYAPQPTLDDVRLEAARREAEGQVRFTIARDLGRVPAGVQLVVHHAMLAGLSLVDRTGGAACVRIKRRGEAIVLSMVLERAADPAEAEAALTGVALRARLYGGAVRWTEGRRLTLTIPELDAA